MIILSIYFAIYIKLAYVGLFQSVALLLIDNLQHKAKCQCCHAETCKHYERCGIVVRYCGLLGCYDTILQVFHQLRICLVKNLTDKQREKPKADVLYPEDEGIRTSDNLRIDKLGDTRPK